MITSVGKFLRKLRIDRGEILRDMATRLGISSAFLSAVENGKKNVPEKWLSELEKLYLLSAEQMEELRNAIAESKGIVELNVRNASDASKRLAISFARQFETLDPETTDKLFGILQKREEKKQNE